MTQPALIGVDLGTSQVKVGLYDHAGKPLARAGRRHPLHHPAPGSAEQDPAAWWDALVGATAAALAAAGPVEVSAISVVGQGPTLVACTAAGEPLRPAITWMDTRAHAHQVRLARVLEMDGFRIGNLPKIAWLAEHEPEVAERAAMFLSSWDYLTLRLSGRAITAIPPTRNQATPEMAKRAGLDGSRLPEPVPWGTALGTVTARAAADLGISPDCVVVAGGNDALGSYLGAGIDTAGQAINNSGSSGGFAVYWTEGTEIPGVYSIPAVVPGLRLFGGAMSATGLALEWMRTVAGGGSLDDLVGAAGRVEPGAGGLVFLPYLAGERSPLWDADARGVFAGLALGHGPEHLTRAVLEAAGYAIRHIAEPILAGGVAVGDMRVAGGGAASAVWNQVKADVTGFPVSVPADIETASMGAAILAAAGSGLRPDLVEAMRAMVRVAGRYEPAAGLAGRYDELYAVYRALYPALQETFTTLAGYRERYG